MAFIQDIIVNISKGTAGLKQKNFRPLIVGTGVAEIDVGIYTELADLVTAGYLTTDDEYKMAAAMWSQSPSPVDIAVYRKLAATAWDAALTTLLTTFTDFWAVLITSKTIADLNTVGTWAGSNKRYFFGEVDDVTAGAARNQEREAYLIHDTAAEFAAAAWVGQNIPRQPGSFTWKWKRLNGVSAAGYDSTEMATIRTNNTQALQEQAGAIYTNEGISTAGEYIDVVHGQDWVEDQLVKEILLLMLKNLKISLDDTGIPQVEAVVRKVLTSAGQNQIIARAITEEDMDNSDDKFYQYKVVVPRRADLSANDLANRDLNAIAFSYWLAGAIHKVRVNGLITV